MEKTNEIYYLNKYKYLDPNSKGDSKKSNEQLAKEEIMRQKELKKNKCRNYVNKRLKKLKI